MFGIDFSSIKEKLNTKSKIYKLIIVIIVIAIIIVLLLTYLPSEKKISTGDYVSDLEKKLETTLSKVKGVGNISVALTVEGGMETVLAMKTETKQSGNITETIETPILVNGKTVVLKEKNPKIIGVLIVCDGGNNIAVINKLQTATKSLIDVDVKNIEILSTK